MPPSFTTSCPTATFNLVEVWTLTRPVQHLCFVFSHFFWDLQLFVLLMNQFRSSCNLNRTDAITVDSKTLWCEEENIGCKMSPNDHVFTLGLIISLRSLCLIWHCAWWQNKNLPWLIWSLSFQTKQTILAFFYPIIAFHCFGFFFFL